MKIVTGSQTRIQEFSPPSGKIKLGRATRYVNDFMFSRV